MKEQLIQYVNLLFAGTTNCEDAKQAVLHDALSHYDDLIAVGKAPEDAYRIAISGIGDMDKILSRQTPLAPAVSPVPACQTDADEPKTELSKSVSNLIWAIGLAAYLLVSFFTGAWYVTWVIFPIVGAVKGLVCALLPAEKTASAQADQRLRKSIFALIRAIGLAAYFLLSFATMAWHITWILFPIIAAVQGLVRAALDLKEAVSHEA